MRELDEPARRRIRRAKRSLIGWVAAACGVVALTAAVPMTSSAFTAGITQTANATGAKARFTCADTFAAERRRQQAYFEYAFDEPSGATTARDSSDAHNTGSYEGANTKDGATPVACPNDGGGAYALDGSSRVTTSLSDGPIITGFSEEIWFKASSAGKLMGYESERSGESPNYDKHLYIDANNRLRYGTDGNGVQTIATTGSVIDGAWHLAVATTTSRGGSVLYLDGAAVASDATMTTGEPFSGYWRIGEGKLAGWTDDPGRRYFTGSLRFAAAYPYVLTAAEVASVWSIGKPGGSIPTSTATATATATAVPVTDPPATEGTVSPAPEQTATAAAVSSAPPRQVDSQPGVITTTQQ